MATARLRKTFRYPDDDSADEDSYRGIDEEEQEKVINDLRKEDSERNTLYKRIFLVIATLFAIAFLPDLFTSSFPRARLVTLLCLLNISTSTYVLAAVPTDGGGKSVQTLWKDGVGHIERKPALWWIEVVNGALSLLLSVNAYTFKGRKGIHHNFWMLCLLPAAYFGLVTLFKGLVASVDIKELERLKYQNKGA